MMYTILNTEMTKQTFLFSFIRSYINNNNYPTNLPYHHALCVHRSLLNNEITTHGPSL